MDLQRADLEILEAACYGGEPWHILFLMVKGLFSDPAEVVRRVLRLHGAGLLTIEPGDEWPVEVEVSEDGLLGAARTNRWYEGMDPLTGWPEGPSWDIRATERGMALLKDRQARDAS